MKKSFITIKFLLLFVILTGGIVFPQHRGDNLEFQGVDAVSNYGVRSTAMGSAYTAITGDVNCLFFNPAGLAGIKTNQISVAGNRYSNLWRETQQYRPDKDFATLSLYLEELFVPPATDIKDTSWYSDGELFQSATYNDPKLGLDPYSKEAANWHRTQSGYSLNNVIAVIPMNQFLGDVNGLVLAVSYNSSKVLNYDRNDTYLDPHPGYTFYGTLPTAGAGIELIKWWRYYRQREGIQNNLNIGTAIELDKGLQVGLKAKIAWGKTDDYLGLDEHGQFSLTDVNQFSFRYAHELDTTYGISKYKSVSLTAGVIYELSKFKIGLQITTPTSITRDWDYTAAVRKMDTLTSTQNIKGSDKLKMPWAYSIGISYTPYSTITLAADVQNTPYGSADYTLTQPDKYFQKWVDQNIFNIGLEFRPKKYLSLSLGYRNIPQAYVPDGSAIKDKGPVAACYTIGAGYTTNWGRIDVAYEYRTLKYYDSYYSNTNYNFELTDNILLSYTINF